MANTNGSSPNVSDCTFSGNMTTVGGGMANGNGSNPMVTRCVFSGNMSDDSGGGMYNVNNSNPIVTLCTFRNNSATGEFGAGGGMYNHASSPTVTHCTFCVNTATVAGGGMYNRLLSPSIIHCIFSGNVSNANGGGMYITQSSLSLIHCTFNGNSANAVGGGMYNVVDSPSVTNCILWGNVDSGGMDESAQIHVDSGTPIVNYSDVQGGWTGTGTGNIDGDPLFVDADGADDALGTDDDDLRLQTGSPAIDAGDATAVPPGVLTDLDGNPRGADDPTTPNTGLRAQLLSGFAAVDMGVYEFQPCLPAIAADLDCNGIVDLVDLRLLALQWLETP